MGPMGKIEFPPGKRGSFFGQSGGQPSPKLLFHNNKEIVLPQILQQAGLHEAIATAIQSRKNTFKTTGEMGLRDIRIAEAIYESDRKGGLSVSI